MGAMLIRSSFSANIKERRDCSTALFDERGSMPALSRTLDEEGIVISPTRVGPTTLHELAARMRNADERLGDFRAQLAAHELAERRGAQPCAPPGTSPVRPAPDEP